MRERARHRRRRGRRRSRGSRLWRRTAILPVHFGSKAMMFVGDRREACPTGGGRGTGRRLPWHSVLFWLSVSWHWLVHGRLLRFHHGEPAFARELFFELQNSLNQ